MDANQLALKRPRSSPVIDHGAAEPVIDQDAHAIRLPVEADPADGEKGAVPTGPAGRPIRRRGPRPGGTPA
jgi:hypothetical protein